MKRLFMTISRLFIWPTVFTTFFLMIGLSWSGLAHPMPTSIVLLNIHANRIDAELQIPLVELQAGWGHAVNDSSTGLVDRLGSQLRTYLQAHTRPQSPDGRLWMVSIGELAVHETQNPISGVYRELTAQVRMVPPPARTSVNLHFITM